MVAVSGETLGITSLKVLRRKMLASTEGRQILAERPVINSTTIDFEYLERLPEHTFGSRYVQFMKHHNITSDSRSPVKYIDDAELAYVMLRYRQIHDFTHVLLGLSINVSSEVLVKAFEAAQTNILMCWGATLAGPLIVGPKHRRRYLERDMKWALTNGWNSKLLMNVYFEKRFEQPIDDLRAELNIKPYPSTKAEQTPV